MTQNTLHPKSLPPVKFNKKDRPEFFVLLRQRVNQHFIDNNISRHCNWSMRLKTVFMLSVYIAPFVLILSGVITSIGGILASWAVMGFGMAGIGLSVMHDANHGAYSSNKRVNKVIGSISNFIGGFHTNWIIQHNVLHHSFTNVHGHDEDIDKGVMRFSPNQEHKKMFRFQAYYATFFYGLMTIYWFIAKDFEQLIRYDRKNLLAGQGLTFNSALAQIIFHKTWYALIFIVLPIMVIPINWGILIAGFLMMHFICGVILAYIFQLAHVIEETSFFKQDETGSVENNWAIHQLSTTANFANTNRVFSWLVGGLNYQIEHHLFPHICHVHYQHLSPIVRKTSEEYGIPYHQHHTFLSALKSHFTLLDRLGKNIV